MKKIKQAEQKEKTDEQLLKKNNAYEALIYTKIIINAPLVKNIKTIFNNPTFIYPEKSNPIFQPPQA